MTSGSHARPAPPPSGHPHAAPPPWRRRLTRRLRPWSLGTPLVVLVCGGLFVVSAQNSEGTDLRPGRYTDLPTLVRAESDRYQALEERVAELNEEVADLSDSLGDRTVNRYRREIETLRDPAGMVEQEGPGVTVTLEDSPPELADAATELGLRLSNYVVHQQDIQAVVNALWEGGAKAVTVQGKRLVSTTGIKCIGNSVTLQGQPYSPPYVIAAVGDQDDLSDAIMDDENLQDYRTQSEDPTIQIGWDMELDDDVTAPAYDGLLDLSYAEPLE